LSGKIQNAHRSSHTKSLAASHDYTLAIVHKHQIRAERNGQCDCGRLPFIEPFHRSLAEWRGWRFLDIKPCRRIGNPVPHRRRSVRVGQLRFHGGWQDHFLEQNWKDIDASDQHQVVDRPGIGDDQPHRLESQLFQSVAVPLKIFHGVVFIHVVGF